MDLEWIMANLPEKPPKGLLSWAQSELTDELGNEYTVMEGVRVREQPTMEELFDNQPDGKSVWAERVYCNACEEEYIAKKVPGMDAFYTCVWEDGTETYMMPESDLSAEEMPQVQRHGDELICPICGAKTTLVHAKQIRGGRTKQIQVSSLHRIGKYAVVCYWLVGHTVEEWGVSYYHVEPRYAYVIGERGGVTAFSHRNPGCFGKDTAGPCWHQLHDAHDRWDARYSDWGSINSTKIGTEVYTNEIPDLEGTTAEKTGLATYWEKAGAYPLDYIRLWRAWKPVEVIVNTGFAGLVESCVGCGTSSQALDALAQVCDLTKKKPHEIMRMSKADYKAIRQRKIKPTREKLQVWNEYLQADGKLSVSALLEEMENRNFGVYGIRAAIDLMVQYHDCDVPKIRRYLEKQEMLMGEVRVLLDARRMQQSVAGRTSLTEEELWPRHLNATHDRLAQMRAEIISAEKAAQFQKGFDAVRETYSEICWHDKDLAITLPKCNADLIREGQVLRHCVGGYGQQHSHGVNIILFVRHYKKPDRPYYTLNIGFRDTGPVRIQLHGYGNERHGNRKQYLHHIPKKVTRFVDKWEAEVLRPWWEDQSKKKNQIKKEKTA